MKRHRYWLLTAILLVWGVLLGQADAGTVRIAHKWDNGNAIHKGFEAAAKGFEAKNPGIKVVIEQAITVDKAKVAMAAGDPPDVYVVWPAVSWGADGFVQPLDNYIKQAGISQSDFVPAAWTQNVWDRKTWGMALQIDPNFAMVWHRNKYAEAGLNPDQAPATVKVLDSYIKRLTMLSTDGKPLQLGMMPWLACGSCGNANEIYTWGWIFGGDFYDAQNNKATAHDDKNVQALEYLKDYWFRYNDMYIGLGSGLPTGRDRFTSGREVSRFMVTGDLFKAMKTFPDLDLGLGKMPVNTESGVDNPAWIGGWSLGLLTGSKNPDEAWKLIQYLTADPEGVSLFAEASGYMPAMIRAPGFRKLGADPQWKPWVDIAITTARFRPAIPVLEFYTQQLNTVYPKLLNGSVTVRAGLEEVSRLVELEMKNKYGK